MFSQKDVDVFSNEWKKEKIIQILIKQFSLPRRTRWHF